jgi:hypothetical protein
MPSASDVHNPSLMSFAPSARAAEVAPLTATPDARPAGKLVDVPLPLPRPKLATASATPKPAAPRSAAPKPDAPKSDAPKPATLKRAATGH